MEDVTSLNEVIIRAKSLDARVKNDTIKYNIKSLTNGREENLKDVLKKLPGVEIDDNGKIKANGKKIDKLLIDGKEFFGEQHQLATENIGSEMVKGVSLIDNFSAFSDVNKGESSGKIAMNIEIDGKYKGNIKGKILVEGGYKSKYNLNTNLFRFGKNTNLFFIGNTNNRGSQFFSVEDYISFQGGIDKFISDNSPSTTTSNSLLSTYLVANNNVESKKEQFSALNFSYNPSKKWRVNGYVILDNVNISEKIIKDRTYFSGGQSFELNIKNQNNAKYLINNTFLDVIYKPYNNSVFEYVVNFSPQKNKLLSNNSLSKKVYNTSRRNVDLSFNQALTFKKNFDKLTLSSTLYHTIKNKGENLNISSNSNFLNSVFKNKNYNVFQKIDNDNEIYGLSAFLSKEITKKLSIKLRYNLEKTKSFFQSDIEDYTNYNALTNTLGVNFYNVQKSFFNYNFGANFSRLDINNYVKLYFLPFANFKFNFGKSHNLNLSYRKTLEFPQVENTIENNYILDFNTLAGNQDVNSKQISKYDNLILNYHIYDLFSGTLLSLGINHIVGANVIAKNTIYFNDYSVNQFKIAKSNKTTSAYLLLDKKIWKIPFKLRFKNTFFHSTKYNFINNIVNKYILNTISNGLEISSNFDSVFNFNFGYSRKQTSISNENVKNTLILNKPYVNLIFSNEKLKFIFNNSIDLYSVDRQFYKVSPALYYTINKKIKIHIKGEDLLNVNKNYIIENSSIDNYFEEKAISTMGGFVVIGFTYKF